MISQIFTGIVVMVMGTYLVRLLGMSNTTTTVYAQGSKKSSKIWKTFVLLGMIMFYIGGFYGFSWAMAEGFSSPQAVTGLAYCFLGFIILVIRKIKLILSNS